MKKFWGIFAIICFAWVNSASAIEKFSDVPDDHWAARSIYNVVRLGVTRGYPDGTFRGTLTINRYELMVFLSNLAISLEQLMDQKLSGTAPIGTPNATNALNDRALEELRAEIETLKAAVLRGEKTVFEPKKTTVKTENPWKIAGGFEFRAQNQTLSTTSTTTTNILPRLNLALTGNFGRSGFLLDVDTDYQDVNTNGLFKNITSNVLAVKGWGKLPISDQAFVLLEGSAGPADYRISDGYQYGSAVRQKVVYRPGNAIRTELNVSGLILSNQFEKRVSSNSGVDRNLVNIGYAFDKEQKNIVSLGLDQYSGLAGQNQRVGLQLGFALTNEFSLLGRLMTQAGSGQTDTFYEIKLKLKALMTELDFQVAQQSPGFANNGPFEIAAVNVYQYEILPGTEEIGFLVKQKLGEILFVRAGYSAGYAYSAACINRASHIAGLGLGVDFDAFSSFGVDYLSVNSKDTTSTYSNVINASFQIRF